jgi:imidazolonepropionase-like amidohydrolase
MSHRRVVLSGVVGFDGETAFDDRRDIVVERGRVRAVTPAGVADRTGASVLDLPGWFVMPGMVNAHEHLTVTHHLTKPEQGRTDAVLGPHWRNLTVAAGQLDYGITSIVGLAGPTACEVAMRDRLFPRWGAQLPRYFTVGPMHTNRGGYPHYVDDVAGRLLTIKAASDTPERARAWVRWAANRGVDAIKVATSDKSYGGAPLPPGMAMRPDLVEATVDEAHRWGLRVFSHSYSAAGFELALRSGVDVLAHLPVDELSDRTVHEVARSRTIVIPTIYHMQVRVNASCDDPAHNGDDFDRAEWEAEFELLENDEHGGAELLRGIYAVDRPLGSSNRKVADPPLDLDLLARSTAHMRSSLRRLHAAGAVIAYGQDSMHALPYREFREWVRCGMSVVDALRAATRNAAATLGLDGDLGVLRPGATADLIVYRRSPLEDVGVLRQPPDAVVHHGQLVRCHPDLPGAPSGVPHRFPPLARRHRAGFSARYLAAAVAGIPRALRAPG